MVVCRLLPYAVADGQHNMAADEVLLGSAAAGVGSLRFYGWSEATLSLGYFQPEQVRRADARFARLPYVRRPTGGATLVHHYEVTYALGLPAGAPLQSGEGWLCRMHRIIAAALNELDVRAHVHTLAGESPFTGTLCFQHLSTGDVLLDQAKVVGSAQRRQRGALLQHGGILLARSMHAPALPGIAELSGRSLSAPATCAAIQRAFARQTGWELAATNWTSGELGRIEELVQCKYSRDTWNRKR